MNFLQLIEVDKIYANGVQALRSVSLSIEPGSFTVILGPSGAGKSTLLRMINGLDRPSSGRVVFNGNALAGGKLRQIRSQIGMVFQQFNLVDRLYVMTNVLCGRLSRRSLLSTFFYLFPQKDFTIARHALTRVGLLDKAWQRADTLSGGQQQRVGVARALAQQPKLILADEPVASLDPVSSQEVLQLLKDICVEDGITIIANLHQVELAKQYADRTIALNAGRIVFDGPPEQLSERVLHRIYHGEEKNVVPDIPALAVAYA